MKTKSKLYHGAIAGLTVGVLVMGAPLVGVGYVASAATGEGGAIGADATITVTVERNDIRITDFNGTSTSASSRTSDESTISLITYKKHNKLTFRAEKAGYARLYLGSEVLWEGAVSGGEAKTIEFDLGDVEPGRYDMRLRLNSSKSADTSTNYAEIKINLDYRAMVPTILPGNSGAKFAAYMEIGGVKVSLTTVIVLLALILGLTILLSEKHDYICENKSEVAAKKNRVKRAKAKAKKRPAKLV